MIKLKHDFHALESTLLMLASELRGKAAAIAMTRTAAATRRDVMAELPRVFDRPTPFTVNSVRYEMATKDRLQARVYISDDAAKGISPRRYLLAEIEGGQRGAKRSEKALHNLGLLGQDQQIVPGRGAALDRFGNISGPTMVQILSRLSAFGEAGYSANASAAVRNRLAKRKVATQQTGTDLFVARSGNDGKPLGIWRLVTPGAKGRRGVVVPVLLFTRARPTYRPRFDFHGLVGRSAAAHWPGEMMKAMHELIERRR